MNKTGQLAKLIACVLVLSMMLACTFFQQFAPEDANLDPGVDDSPPGAEPTPGEVNEETIELSGEVVLKGLGLPQLAVQGPVTGQFSAYYSHFWNVVNMAVTEPIPGIDSSTAIVPLPANIEVDDRCEKSAGESAAKQLIMEYPDVIGVIGPFCSGAARGALPIYHQAGLVSISGSATGENLSTLFGMSYFNRTVLNDGQLQELGLPEDWNDDLSSVRDFYTRYESRYGEVPDEIRPYMPYIYDAVHVLLYSIEIVAVQNSDGSITIERSALAEAVRHIEGFTGVTGLIEFDKDGDRVP